MLTLWREEDRIILVKTFIIYQSAFVVVVVVVVDFNSRL